MQDINAQYRKLVFGLLLAGVWASGLFIVLEAETLFAKAVILLALAPLSLELDRLVSKLVRRPAYLPVPVRATESRNEVSRRCPGELSAAQKASIDERLAA